MTPERLRHVTAVFQGALALDAAERYLFIVAHCGDDAELRREVEAMLARHGEASPALATTGTFDRASAVERHAQAPGGQLGSYEILSLAGSGGMGDVYLARDTVLHRKVAIKLLRADLTRHPTLLARFEQEARAASSLNHPNIITIYETRLAAEHRFIAMEYVDGRPLTAVIGKPIDMTTVRSMARQLAEALKVAHAAGIVHRDVKPSNVMVRSDGYLKLLDFGVARLSLESDDGKAGTPVRTASGHIVGTPRYMSPEQIRGEPATEASDIFSLGAVLHELTTGRHPSEHAPAQGQLDPLHALVRRMLAPQPADRPSAADVEREVRRLELAAARRTAFTQRKGVVIAASLLAVAVLVWMAVAAYQTGRQRMLTETRAAAAEVFFNLRALDRDLVRLRQKDPESIGVREAVARRNTLAQAYDNHVELLGLYHGKSPTEAAILRLARRMGEVDMEVPAGFRELTMAFVQRWSESQRLGRSITAARQRNLISLIQRNLEARGLAKELALVALQESGFDSKSIGPVTRRGVPKGLWQMTPAVARQYDLKLGLLSEKPVYDAADERHDEIKSTVAATRHLADLYSSTAGSALLVIASYNSGEGVVLSRLQSMPDDPRVKNFWSFYNNQWLSAETLDYVMYVFSAALICEQPELFGFSFERIW